MFYVWLGVVIVLAVIEALTVNLTTIWFVMSGIASLVISFITDSILIQFAVFVILGFILLIFTKPLFVKKFGPKKEKTNLDRIIGMKGYVTEEIDEDHLGAVKVDGKVWTAMSHTSIPKGSSVIIQKIEGVKLVVEKR